MSKWLFNKKMKTKLVYCLVSSPADYFWEQTYLSIYSARLHNRGILISLVVDKTTAEGLVGSRARLIDCVDEYVQVDTPDGYSSMCKSRYLKTNVRSLITGDFLFIDSDTIICDTLSEIDDMNDNIAMVADLNGGLSLFDVNTINKYASAGFGEGKGLPYFNSGVIYAKDNDIVRAFYNRWFENLQISFNNNVFYDQPALCATNVQLNFVIKELSGIWNCQFKMKGYPFLKRAKIMHYYSNNGIKSDSAFVLTDLIFQRIRIYGDIDDLIANLARNAKRKMYAIMTLQEEQLLAYNSSNLLYTYTNRPRLYKLVEKIVVLIEKILYVS